MLSIGVVERGSILRDCHKRKNNKGEGIRVESINDVGVVARESILEGIAIG